MEQPEAPNSDTERRWLADGLQNKMIRHETAKKLMDLLDSLDAMDTTGEEGNTSETVLPPSTPDQRPFPPAEAACDSPTDDE